MKYKPQTPYQLTMNENTWLKARVRELETEVETLHQEIGMMQDGVEVEEIFDEETYDEIQLPHGDLSFQSLGFCRHCNQEVAWNVGTGKLIHLDTLERNCVGSHHVANT